MCFVAFFFAFDALLPYKDGEVRARVRLRGSLTAHASVRACADGAAALDLQLRRVRPAPSRRKERAGERHVLRVGRVCRGECQTRRQRSADALQRCAGAATRRIAQTTCCTLHATS